MEWDEREAWAHEAEEALEEVYNTQDLNKLLILTAVHFDEYGQNDVTNRLFEVEQEAPENATEEELNAMYVEAVREMLIETLEAMRDLAYDALAFNW